MGLLLRHDTKTGVILSLGDPPNGVLGLHYDDGFSFMVNPYRQPEEIKRNAKMNPEGHAGNRVIEGSLEDMGSVAVETEDVVIGCESDAVYPLWMTVCEAARMIATDRLPEGYIDEFAHVAEFVVEVHRLLYEHHGEDGE